MRTCNCTLCYTNPEACKSCPNNKDAPDTNAYQPYNLPVIRPVSTPVKRVIEEFDKDGKLTKRTTEEDLYLQHPLYMIDGYACFPTPSQTVGDPVFGQPVTNRTTGDCHVNVT